MIVDWDAKCEVIVQTTKRRAESFRKHLNWRSDTNLTATKFSNFQNYCDNESILIIFTELECADSALQFWLVSCKSYVILDWCVRCEIIARRWSVLKWSWRMSRLRTWIKYWLNLSTLSNEILVLIRILSGRSFALSEYTGHFFIDCVLSIHSSVKSNNNFWKCFWHDSIFYAT